MGRIGVAEIVFVLLIVILLFGARKLPEIGKALGEAIREFRNSGKEDGGHKTKSEKDKGK